MTVEVQAYRDPTLLALAFVANRDRPLVFQGSHRVGEANAMLAKVRSGRILVVVYTWRDDQLRLISAQRTQGTPAIRATL